MQRHFGIIEQHLASQEPLQQPAEWVRLLEKKTTTKVSIPGITTSTKVNGILPSKPIAVDAFRVTMSSSYISKEVRVRLQRRHLLMA